MEDDFVGAIKIKDGLFIGDEYASQDFEFIVTNKVTHIINCAGKQIPNYWESVGVLYLTFDWDDSETQIVFDNQGEIVNQIHSFVEEAAKLGEGVLVHSVKGQSRSCCVLTAYFMKRYRWSLYKTLEFLTSRRSDLEIRTSFYHQLLNLESRLFQQSEGSVTVNWHDLGQHNDHEELILRNTFLNARSAPFDEALVNPQAGVDNRPRKLNWGDERPSHNGGLAFYFNNETLAALMAKPSLNSVKSILKGSNKVFKLKSKSLTEEVSSSTVIVPRESSTPGLKANKSMRNFSESRTSEPIVDDVSLKVAADKGKDAYDNKQEIAKVAKGPNMSRSSSASYFEKEENPRASAKGSFSNNEKPGSAKVANINGNVIHLTVNNYLAPVNNVNNTAQMTNSLKIDSDSKTKQAALPIKAPEARPLSHKYNLPSELKKEENEDAMFPDSSSNKNKSSQIVDRSALSTNYLKSAIEKKLSKEYKSQASASSSAMPRGGIQPVTAKSFGNEKMAVETKASFKEYAKPTDIKVNYQVLLKNRETPPPRKRDESKKVLESPVRKAATTKNSFSAKAADNSGLPYSSYLNNLFATSLGHLNAITPSGYGTNQSSSEKKTPVSTKATPVSYSLSQKAQALARPQRSNLNQLGDRNFVSSVLTSSFSKSKLLPNEPASATHLSSKYNNYIPQANQPKGNPVRISYEKVDRPHSATPDRSVTPQSGMKRLGSTINSGFKPEQRTSAPLKSNKSIKKELGLSEDMMLSKYRQRSSSPLQVAYNPVLSSSSISLKSRPKY